MSRLKINPSNIKSVAQHLVCSNKLRPRRMEFASNVVEAYAIVRRFANLNGWEEYMRKLLFTSIKVFESQEELWSKIRNMTKSPEKHPPTDGLSAALIYGCLMSVSPEEYERLRPEYALIDRAWTRLMAHEMVHQLHIRIIGTEDKMGPQWFYEGLAMHAAGQRFGGHVIAAIDDVIEAMHAESRGSYVKYVAAFEFFIERVNLNQMLQRAANHDFETWLIASAVSAKE